LPNAPHPWRGKLILINANREKDQTGEMARRQSRLAKKNIEAYVNTLDKKPGLERLN
jgi:hypothetical protein